LNLKKADMLWFGSNAPQVFFHQYKSLGGNLPICLIGYDWMTWDEKQDAGDDCLGVITTGEYSSLLDTPEVKAFVAKYGQATGHIADCYDEGGYTEMKILLQAIEYTKGDTSSKALTDALYKLTFDTPRGKVSFNPGGWLECPQYIFKYVRADGFISLEPLEQHPIYQPSAVTWSYSKWSPPE
jgi:ABC-type branched-subunit amino acid transport system substrate-binding protein